jgi:DNA-binding Lrp family transcriptional regulator
MDDIDKKIISLLREDARLPLKTLAASVGLARSTARDRIDKLERAGIIRGYHAHVVESAATSAIRAFLLLRLTITPARDALKRISAMKRVKRFYSVSGDIDLIVEIEAGTMLDLNETRDAIAALPQVADVTTAPVLKVERE